MQIYLNGDAHTCTDSFTVLDLLTERGLAERRVAVEVNQTLVPRSQHDQFQLGEGDRVEIIHAIGGG